MIFWIIVFLIFWTILWVVWLRNWLACRPWRWSRKMFAIIEPIEITLWRKSETILWARAQQFLGAMMIILPWAGALDLTPYLQFLPPEWHPWVRIVPPAAIALNGLITELLRYSTTKPVSLVAVPDYKPVPEEVKAAMADADATKKAAVEAVKEAKVEGTV